MIIFVYGIASMFVTDYLDWETVSEMLSDAYKGFLGAYKGENK